MKAALEQRPTASSREAARTRPVWLVGAGVALAALVGTVSGILWGSRAAIAAVVLGLVATGIQAVAHRLMQRPTNPRSPFPAGWLAGTALRMGGIVVMAVAVVLDRERFAPLPAALGYLGVLIPLLMLELRKT